MNTFRFPIRKILSVCGCCTAIFLLHLIPHRQIDIVGDQRMPFLIHGLPFTRMPPKKDKPRVIIMGNSVMETTAVATILLNLEERSSRKFELGNFSLSGTSVGDYLFIYNYVRKFKPDLLVVDLYPMTFAIEKPLFRHKAHLLVFLPEMKELRCPLVLDTYSRDELVESFVYSYFPLYRSFAVWKYRLREKVSQWCREFIHIPVMDIMPQVMLRSLPPIRNMPPEMSSEELEKSWEWLVFLVEQLERDRQKTVFILQETSLAEPLRIYRRLPGLFSGKKYVQCYDLRRYFVRENFADQIHPDDKRGSLISAIRLSRIINKHLAQ